MGSFFNMDGWFFRAGTLIADVFILSLIWFLFSIPIVTMGASFTALFYVSTKRVSNREGYLFKDFLKSFKMNFKQATVVWVLILGAILILFTNIKIIGQFENFRGILLPIYLFLIAEVFMLFVYVFPLIARFDMKFKELLKTALFMANKHLLTTVLCFLLVGSLCLLTYLFPPLVIADAGIYSLLSSLLMMRLFKKYRPEIDNDIEIL